MERTTFAAISMNPWGIGSDAGQQQQQPADKVPWTHQMFVEKMRHPSAQPIVNEMRDFVGDFPASLSRSEAARRIHGFLSDLAPRLHAVEAFADDTSDQAHAGMMDGLEKLLVQKLYKVLFRHAPADLREDEHVQACIRQAGASQSRLLDAAPSRTDDAAAELQKAEQWRAPRDKAICLMNAVAIVEEIAEECSRAGLVAVGDSQDLVVQDILAGLIVKAEPPNLYSNLEFTIAFRHPSRLSGSETRRLRDLRIALDQVMGKPRQKEETAEPGAEAAKAAAAFPRWLADAGVTFHFEEASADDLKIGEVDELLDEYHRMARALRELSAASQ